MIRIALQMLIGDRTKYLGLVFGVGFACFLITTLMGMFTGMLQRTHALIDDTAADIWVMDSSVEYIEEIASLPDTAVQRVRGVSGVKWATPLFIGTLRARLDDGRFRSVQVIGVDDATLIGLPPPIRGLNSTTLRGADAVIVDEASSRALLRRANSAAPLVLGDAMLINDRRALIAGFCDVSPRFMPKPTIYSTYSRALAFAPPERRLMSFVLVRAAEGTNPAAVARSIERTTGFRARTADEFRRDTISYYIHNTDMIAHVGLMVLLGTIVGFAIVALLLSIFTQENARYYAALKAMGAGNRMLLLMLTAQAFAAGFVGFGLGTGGAFAMGSVSEPVGVPFAPMGFIPAATATCVALICVVSIFLNARPILRLEPAIVFRA